jgi:hypothetical protein
VRGLVGVSGCCNYLKYKKRTEWVLPKLALEGREFCSLGLFLLLLIPRPRLKHYGVQQGGDWQGLLPVQSLAECAVTILLRRSQFNA